MSTAVPAPASAHASAPACKTLVDVAYHALREQILDGRLPAGAKLRVEHLRESVGVGATPLREALSRLSAEKLVHALGQRGFRVAPMSLAELDDVTENRLQLETRAVELSVKRGDLAWEARVVAAHHTVARGDRGLRGKGVDVAAWQANNAAFHHALVSACGSPWLLELRSLIFDQHSRYRAMSIALNQRRGATRDVAAEHEAIVEAALARQAKRAAALVGEHIRATTVTVREALEGHLS
jgi:GntR family carbon starvation induced transcriptional regulator